MAVELLSQRAELQADRPRFLFVGLIKMGDGLTADVLENNVDVVTIERVLDWLEQAEPLKSRGGLFERAGNVA